MNYLIARISNKAVVEITSIFPSESFMEAIATNYGGVSTDYTYYTLTDEVWQRIVNGDEYALIWDGNTITGIDFSAEDSKGWLSVEASSSVNKVNFSIIDISKVEIFQADTVYNQSDLVYYDNMIYKAQVATTDGVSTPDVNTEEWSAESSATLVTLKILLADKVTVDTSATFTDSISVGLPNGREADMEVSFTSGVCEKPIIFNSMDVCGTWVIPSSRSKVTLNSTEYKVAANATFKGILPY